MRKKGTGDRTFETVRARYDAWAETRPPRPAASETWSPRSPEPVFSMGKIILSAIGVGIGVLLLVLAGLSFWTASRWAAFDREAGVVGYVVIGMFLIVAGVSVIAATLNHTLRVLDPRRRPAHGHH